MVIIFGTMQKCMNKDNTYISIFIFDKNKFYLIKK